MRALTTGAAGNKRRIRDMPPLTGQHTCRHAGRGGGKRGKRGRRLSKRPCTTCKERRHGASSGKRAASQTHAKKRERKVLLLLLLLLVGVCAAECARKRLVFDEFPVLVLRGPDHGVRQEEAEREGAEQGGEHGAREVVDGLGDAWLRGKLPRKQLRPTQPGQH